jgi:hypothetical protein
VYLVKSYCSLKIGNFRNDSHDPGWAGEREEGSFSGVIEIYNALGEISVS